MIDWDPPKNHQVRKDGKRIRKRAILVRAFKGPFMELSAVIY